MIKIKNKKAQIGPTLVWIVAAFIILFILIIFIATSLFLSLKKEDIYISKESETRSDLPSTINLVSFLKTEVFGETMQNLILSSLDSYFEIKSKNGESLVDWAFKTYLSPDSLEKIDFNKAAFLFDENELKKLPRSDKNFAKEFSKVLDPLCSEYYLQIPQGIVMSGGRLSNKKILGEDPFYNKEDKLKVWTPTVSFNIPYKGRIFEIKYKQLREC